jgi:hypothetical protein
VDLLGEHLVELDEAHRLPREPEELVKRFVVLDGMPPALRLPPVIEQGLQHAYSQEIQRAVRDALIAEAFKGRIIRYAWQDQHPKAWSKDRLRNAARDSVIRYAIQHRLTFKFSHDQWGERWTWNQDQKQWHPSGVYGWSSEAEIMGRTSE